MAARAAVLYAIQRGVAIITLNSPPVNALGHAVRQGIQDGLQKGLDDSAVRAFVIRGGGSTFCAGADISEFAKGGSNKDPVLTDVIDAIEASTKPVVAAIHGQALGGGLEVALGCHYRIGDKDCKVGLPEVLIGIIPGAGGTQRLPRLIGAPQALEVITSGAHIPAAKALKMGILDKIATRDLVEEATDVALELTASPVMRRTRNLTVKSADRSVFEGARKLAAKKMRGFVAPLKCIDAVAAAAELPYDEGIQRERQLFIEAATGPQARAQQYFFFAEREASKIPGIDPGLALPIKSAGILGAGTMGVGIAMNFLNAGIPVVLLEAKQEFLDKGVQRLHGLYAEMVSKGRIPQAKMDAVVGILRPTLSYVDLASCDIVIEAVFEDMALKKDIFRQLDAVCRPDAVLASNTSTLNIDEIAAVTRRPERVCGTHFFSPANVMKLLENVRGRATSASTIATIMQMSKKINKKGVLVGVCKGFAGNRALHRYGAESNLLVEEGAYPEDVDSVMMEFGLPMGPFQMFDLAGLDVGYLIRKGENARGEAERNGQLYPHVLNDRIYDMGRYGQKTGAGWYRYEAGSRKALPDPIVRAMIDNYSRERGVVRRPISREEILERCLLPAINESFKILEEGIAIRPSDIDVIWVYGYGWPVYRGGPMHYADALGLDNVLAGVKKYWAKYGWTVPHWEPSRLLERLANEGTTLAAYWKEHAKSAKPRL